MNVKVKGDFKLKLYEGREWNVDEDEVEDKDEQENSENNDNQVAIQHKTVSFEQSHHSILKGGGGKSCMKEINRKKALFKNDEKKVSFSYYGFPCYF